MDRRLLLGLDELKCQLLTLGEFTLELGRVVGNLLGRFKRLCQLLALVVLLLGPLSQKLGALRAQLFDENMELLRRRSPLRSSASCSCPRFLVGICTRLVLDKFV